jgi:hypothetical protein
MTMRIIICVIGISLMAALFLVQTQPASELIYTDLEDVERRPMDPSDKTGSVLIFYWQDCPISNSYAPELNRIAADHTNFAFYIVQVDPDLTRATAKEHALKFDLREPVLLDPHHQLVKLVHATVAPEAVVISKDGRVAYRGRIDNNFAALQKKRARATQHDLIDAMDSVAAGKTPTRADTTAIGCLIQ